MKDYRIKKAHRTGETYETMIISNRETGEKTAEYRLTPGEERREIAAMRRAINTHLDSGGGLGNYQW